MIIREYKDKDTSNRTRVYVDVECQVCKSIFKRQKRQLKEHCCSSKCLSVVKGTGSLVNCAYCSIEFQISNRRKYESKSGLFFCCREHKDIGQKSIKEIQPNHYGKGDGKYNYRQKALEIYGCKCQMCGFDNPLAIVVHHIDHNRNNNDIDNLIVLCANCHYIAHEGNFIKG